MKILIACEFSGKIREAFRKKSHDAWSCDLIPAEDKSRFHIQRDVLSILDQGWDMMIGHPPCRFLSYSGVQYLKNNPERWKEMKKAALFFRKLLLAPIKRKAIENPVIHNYALKIIGRDHDQIIQPYQFGEDASKRTCLWLENLPPLKETKFIEPKYHCKCGFIFSYQLGKYGCPNCFSDSEAAKPRWSNQTAGGHNKLWGSDKALRAKLRSVTFSGIAEAMADQWG